jgi:uncharacterized protein (TIGR00266 family)
LSGLGLGQGAEQLDHLGQFIVGLGHPLVVLDQAVDAVSLGVSATTFYPVTDGYRDGVAIRGTLHESASVTIRIYSVATGKIVRSINLGTKSGAYSWVWNGRTAAGTLLGAGKRLLIGESLFMTVFQNRGVGKKRVAFGAPYPGKIIPIQLSQVGGELLAQKDAFLCAAKGVSLGIAFTKRFGAGLFGGEGFILERLQGDGLAFIHAGGAIYQRDLAPGEVLRVDTGCIVAFQPTIDYDIQFVGKIKSALFGGEGLFFATLRGPGRVWLQSLPLSRLANRIIAAVPRVGRGGREEGSILGGLGGLLDGDNS